MVKNYMEILYDNETIHTPRLILRKFRKSDAPDVFEWASDEVTVKWLTIEAKKTVDESVDSIVNYFWSRPGIYAIELRETVKSDSAEGNIVSPYNRLEFPSERPGLNHNAGNINCNQSSKCIGCIDLRLKPDHEKAKFGYVLNRAFWNNGYMTEALSAVIAFCFEKLQLNRVESTYYVGNEASGRVMEKAGLRREGLAVGQEKIKGIFHDLVHLGITREQYFA